MLFYRKQFDLCVVIASCRPTWLANCLTQFSQQSHGGLGVSPVVVCEGDRKYFEPVVRRFGVRDVVYKGVEGRWGAYAKDEGVALCNSAYVCFWDDDNVYYPHALATLYATASGYDIGVVQAGAFVPGEEDYRFPAGEGTFDYGNVDTMCFAVRTELARKERWSDHGDKGTDHAWLQKLLRHNPTVRRVDVKIGEKLINFS